MEKLFLTTILGISFSLLSSAQQEREIFYCYKGKKNWLY